MKTMTCKQMGGPCDTPFQGNSGDEVIKMQDAHLKDMVAKGDTAHEAALQEMQGRWSNPAAGQEWYQNTKNAFDALPEDK